MPADAITSARLHDSVDLPSLGIALVMSNVLGRVPSSGMYSSVERRLRNDSTKLVALVVGLEQFCLLLARVAGNLTEDVISKMRLGNRR